VSSLDASKAPPKRLVEIATDEIKRRLEENLRLHALIGEYGHALTRAAQLIDFATDGNINPEGYRGEMKRLLAEHQLWIEKQRAKGMFPRLHGTKAPVARPKRRKSR
jgi:hypothetical protein